LLDAGQQQAPNLLFQIRSLSIGRPRMKTLSALLAIALAFGAYFHLYGAISYPAGVLVESAPEQIAISDGQATIERGEYHLKPLARFSLDARILHRKTYKYDRESKLVPVDLAVGWGPMSDQAVLDRITISQSTRFYWYEYQSPPIPKEQIISHSTNLHVIPATPAVASFCKSLRQGELVHLDGVLVEATVRRSAPGAARSAGPTPATAPVN
jgi:hypothetical protein